MKNIISKFNCIYWLSRYKTESIENIQYDIFQYKIPTVLFWENLQIYWFFFALVISFKLFQTHCTVLCLCFPIKMTWNRVFLSETGGKSRLCFGKTIWNQVFFSETSRKSRLCFGKPIWNRAFLSETSEKLRLCLKVIISELCLFVFMKWLQFKKSWLMTIFIWIFVKKGSQNLI
jgi:hypothetical protein